MLRLVCDYIGVTQFANYMFNLFLNCVFKISSHISSIDVTPFILRPWCIVCVACGTVWSGFGGVSVRQVALWCVSVCVLCVCVCGVCGCVCVCVCVCGVCGCVCVWFVCVCVCVGGLE